jgi:predicted nucleotidyltransferase
VGYTLRRDEERTRRLEREIERIVPILSSHGVEKIVLFGSLSRGDAGPASDLDLIVVQRTEKRFLDRIDDIIRLINPRCAIDILVYTPEEMRSLPSTSRFVRAVLHEGKVLYEKR